MRGVRTKLLVAGVVVLGALAAAGLSLRASQARAAQRAQLDCLRQAVEAFTPIRQALGAWSHARRADSLSELTDYPATFKELLDAGYLKQLPPNPFGTGTLTELKPGEPDRIGGFRYVPVYATYTISTGGEVKEPYHYMFVLYTPIWPEKYDEPPFGGRLGPGPLYAVPQEQPPDDLGEPEKTPRVKALIKVIYDSHYDSVPEALKRAGY